MTAQPIDSHPLVAGVSALHADLDLMPTQAWEGLEAGEVRRLTAELSRVEARVSAQKMAAARALESAGTARKIGATSTGNMLARDFGGDEAAGHRLVKTAKKLEKTNHTQQALAKGEVTFEQSSVIANGLDKLPADVTDLQRDLAERTLLKAAERLTIKDLRRRTDRLMDVYAPKAEVDAHENDLLVDRERMARQNASFVMWDKKNGMYAGRFELPEAEAVMLKTAVEALAAPSRAHLTDPDATLGPIPEDSERDPAKRMGRAFTDLCSHLPIDELPSNGGVGAQTVITFTYDTLAGGVEAATLSDGTRLSASQARKYACRVGMIPMVFDSKPLPLDYGYSKRYFEKYQRIGMAQRDGGCTFPTCDRPPEWCEAHHRTPVSEGGKTDLKDGTLLCTRHHHHVHDNDWQSRTAPDGHIEWRPAGSTVWQRNPRNGPAAA